MNIVSLENVSKNYGFRPLFANVTLGLEDRGIQAAEKNQPATNDKPKPKKLTFKETRELESIELRIAAAETRLPLIEKELTLAATDAGKVHELFIEQQGLETQLEADMTRWAELAERME